MDGRKKNKTLGLNGCADGLVFIDTFSIIRPCISPFSRLNGPIQRQIQLLDDLNRRVEDRGEKVDVVLRHVPRERLAGAEEESEL